MGERDTSLKSSTGMRSGHKPEQAELAPLQIQLVRRPFIANQLAAVDRTAGRFVTCFITSDCHLQIPCAAAEVHSILGQGGRRKGSQEMGSGGNNLSALGVLRARVEDLIRNGAVRLLHQRACFLKPDIAQVAYLSLQFLQCRSTAGLTCT